MEVLLSLAAFSGLLGAGTTWLILKPKLDQLPRRDRGGRFVKRERGESV